MYTWTMLREVVDSSAHPDEPGHQIRLLVGSGMPPALWERALHRFAPAQVVEFYTASDAQAVLVNLGVGKVGALGRPLPGSARVRVIAWDLEGGHPILDRAGHAVRTPTGGAGMLVAEVEPPGPRSGQAPVLRGLFAPEDAWTVTGDLVRRDRDGELWLEDQADALFTTPGGLRSPKAMRDALERLEEVSLAVVYPSRRGSQTAAVAAVVPTPAFAGTARAALLRHVETLPPHLRPDVLHTVARIPMTEWFRPTIVGLPDAPGSEPVPGENVHDLSSALSARRGEVIRDNG